MKKVCRKLAKKYYTPLKKVNANKVFTAQMTDKLKAYDLMREISDDLVYYQLEILYRGICNKECLEEMFLDAYVKMYDYWQDLDYQQRKHQVNVDLQPYLEQMCCFVYEGEAIYLPMFDRRMNQLYREEMVLFALKQYQRFKHAFQPYLHQDLYGHMPYASDFCSAELLLDDGKDWVLYEKRTTTLYLIQHDTIVETICLKPSEPCERETLLLLVEDYRKADEIAFLRHLLEYHLCDVKMEKKLERLLEKKRRKAEKQHRKKHKGE